MIDKGLWSKKDSNGTVKGHKEDTTTNPIILNPKSRDKKKIKKKSFSPPTKNEVKTYFLENGFTESAGLKAFDYYAVADWKDSRGNQVKNWKQKMRGVWFKDENKINNPKDQHNNFKEKTYESTPESEIAWL